MKPNKLGGRTLEGFEVRVALMAIHSDPSLDVDWRQGISKLVDEISVDGRTRYELPLDKRDTGLVMG